MNAKDYSNAFNDAIAFITGRSLEIVKEAPFDIYHGLSREYKEAVDQQYTRNCALRKREIENRPWQ